MAHSPHLFTRTENPYLEVVVIATLGAALQCPCHPENAPCVSCMPLQRMCSLSDVSSPQLTVTRINSARKQKSKKQKPKSQKTQAVSVLFLPPHTPGCPLLIFTYLRLSQDCHQVVKDVLLFPPSNPHHPVFVLVVQTFLFFTYTHTHPYSPPYHTNTQLTGGMAMLSCCVLSKLPSASPSV